VATRTATLRVKREKKPSRPWLRRLKKTVAFLFISLLIGTTYLGFRFMAAYHHAEELVDSGMDDKVQLLQVSPSKIVSHDGMTLYQLSDVYRKPLGGYDKIPPFMRDAIIAAEDKRFFQHAGVDPVGIARAVFGMAKDGGHASAGGGSTITMQLAKRLFSNGQQSLDRKLQDITVALVIERKYSKQQILTMYLDQVYFGSGAYGVQAAAEIYFGKPVDKLTLGECAMLARCVQRPSDVNPYKNLERSTQNRDLVLANMLDMKTITQEQYDKAIAEKPKLRQKTVPTLTVDLQRAPYFVQHVLTELKDKFNIDLETLKSGGYTIKTTLDWKTEKVAEREVRKICNDYRSEGVTTAAFVLMDKDGQIKAEVGGKDYHKRSFNIVTQGSRQPGSSFKPYVYSAAFSEGKLGIYDSLPDEEYTFEGDWTPRNSNGKTGGPVPVRTAFMWSMNIPAAHVMEMVGPPNAVDFAHSVFGFTEPFKPYMALVLGAQPVHPIEMAQGYSVFMNRGSRATPYTITEIDSPDSEPQMVNPTIIPNVLAPEVADDIDALMRAVATRGTGHEADEIPNARGKTGTTSDNKDAWFCGYSDGLVGIGWVGNETVDKNGKPHYGSMGRQVFGGTVTVHLWLGVMREAHDRLGVKMADRPLAREFGELGIGAGSGAEHGGGNTNGDPGQTPDDFPTPDKPGVQPPPDDNGGPNPNPDNIPPPTDPSPPPVDNGGGGGGPPPPLNVHRRK
jgi:penicillin-binding protein 1A